MLYTFSLWYFNTKFNLRPKEVFFKKITFLHTYLNNNLLFFWTFWHTVALGKYEQNITNFKKCYHENIIILRCQLWYSILEVSLAFHFDRYKVYLQLNLQIGSFEVLQFEYKINMYYQMLPNVVEDMTIVPNMSAQYYSDVICLILNFFSYYNNMNSHRHKVYSLAY